MSDRKKDHIDLAFKSQLDKIKVDERFNYEPMLKAHPEDVDLGVDFLNKKMRIPVWVSSMTGGTELAEKINTNLAKACNEFGMGMGLGSCRMLLDGDTYLHQFNVRHIIGDELPLFANLGISQVEKLIKKKEIDKIEKLVDKLKVDGLFVHVNPMQEFFQPEGDIIQIPPIETIQQLTELTKTKIMVKEVGQGIGPDSLKELMNLQIAGIEFAAFGGTNFANLELMRNKESVHEMFGAFVKIGHTAEQMVDMVNKISQKKMQIIISGGIKSFLDGYYLIEKSQNPAIYGQASTFLKYAKDDYSDLKKFIEYQIKGLKLAYTYLKIKE